MRQRCGACGPAAVCLARSYLAVEETEVQQKRLPVYLVLCLGLLVGHLAAVLLLVFGTTPRGKLTGYVKQKVDET